MIVPTYNHSTGGAEAGRSQLWGQSGLNSESLAKAHTKTNESVRTWSAVNNTQVSPPTTTTHLFSLGEFWLGLEKIYAIVQQSNYILRLELQDWKDSKHYVEYSLRLGSHETNYTLHLAKTAGNVPEALPEHGDLMFSTWDHRAKGQLYCPESYSGISLMPILFSSKYPSTV